MTDKDFGPRLSIGSPGLGLRYDRSRVTPGIVHLGIGAFCRAHLAAYADDLLATDPSWGIVGASLRRPDTRKALQPQDFLYVLAVRNGEGARMRVIGSVLNVLDATTQRSKLVSAMADPRIRIVSLTVTEKGYCHDPATGRLDPEHPDIRHDLMHQDSPVSAPGLIVRACELRRLAGVPPFTVVCCDNLPANGQTVARIVAGFAALRDPALADYIEREVAFPSTMVDRIVPATTDDDRRLVFEATGFRDAWPVVTEPFTQWVIEDGFTHAAAPFAAVGAQLVDDVRPFELMKLRMLNGSHSALAYLGYLAGYDFISDAIGNEAFRKFTHSFMTEEVMSTLPPALGDLSGYRDALLARFDNPALKHRTWQVAMDGSQKLPQRLLGTVRDRLVKGLPITRVALGVAAWMRYVTGVDERNREIDVKDPLAARLQTVARASGGAPRKLIDGLLAVTEIFGDDLPESDSFRAVLNSHLTSLFQRGALATVRHVNRLS